MEQERGKKADKQTLYERLDYQLELSKQNLANPYLLLYNPAGSNVSSASFARSELDLPFVVEHKLYWASFATLQEADYLAAILNSNVANDAIKPFQSLGLMGERDIEKKLLNLPIPMFNPDAKKHVKSAGIAAKARSQGRVLVKSADFPDNLARRRKFIRVGLADTMKLMDNIAQTLLQPSTQI